MAELQRNFVSVCEADAWVDWTYNDADDLKSIRRWLSRRLAPSASDTTDPDTANGEPFVYVEPIEATFQRPAVTVQLLPGGVAENTQGANSPVWAVEHQLVITAYGSDRAHTVALGEQVFNLLNGAGAPREYAYVIPMWSFALKSRLARMMRVLPRSLAMGLEDRNEADIWSRPIEVRVRSPRSRIVTKASAIQTVALSGEVNG